MTTTILDAPTRQDQSDGGGRPRTKRKTWPLAVTSAAIAMIGILLVFNAKLGPGGAPSPTPTRSSAADVATRWRPELGQAWQWQLSVPVDTSVDAPVYDIDMSENSAAVVAQLHAEQRHVICYIDVGSYENFRPDASRFPAAVLGKTNDWPGERWLDIRQLSVLAPIMTARFDECAAKGFDAVEPDLMDEYTYDTGFPLTASDQLRYNRFIATLGHSLGLAVGLKNDLTQIPELINSFDFAVNEQCAEYNECSLLVPFIAAGKPVFHAEYSVPNSVFCPITTALGFSSIRKRLNLDAWRDPC